MDDIHKRSLYKTPTAKQKRLFPVMNIMALYDVLNNVL
jgi:hypothetical protein